MNSDRILVSICCITFNHAPYIRQCLDGFMMQKTDFSFEVLIHDDASTDGTQEIICEYVKKYPDVIKPIYQVENQYSKGVKVGITYNFPRAKGKYIALCEGDDYWIDPLKLQKQVDFLNNNSEYSLCCHRYICLDMETKLTEKDGLDVYFKNNISGISFDSDFNYNKIWVTKTLTVMFRKDVLDILKLYKYSLGRDTILFYYVLKSGKGFCINQALGCYRKHIGGICSKVSKVKRHKDLYISYKEMFQIEGDSFLKYKMYSEFCNYFIYSLMKSDLHINCSSMEFFSLFYYLPYKVGKRGIEKISLFFERVISLICSLY